MVRSTGHPPTAFEEPPSSAAAAPGSAAGGEAPTAPPPTPGASSGDTLSTEPSDDAPRSRHDGTRTILAGIGASAGGIEALRELFLAVPPDLGVAYLVVVHLAPDQESSLASILAACTRMPVEQVTGTTRLRGDHVYVIPPGRSLEISGDSVTAQPFAEPGGSRAPIDMLFRSMAVEQGDGFGILLSGGGSDGAIGLKAIKEGGGLVLVQDPDDAAFDSMPRAAIATGVADVVLPIRALAGHLADLTRAKRSVQRTLGNAAEELDDEERAIVARILGYLYSRTGHDFASYKPGTVLRRIGRRMQVHRKESLADYLGFLKQHAEEVQALFDDLLISVTSFFRDPAVWQGLAQQVIPKLFDRLEGPDARIRCWVPACATGEEAYSLAILLLEEAERRERFPTLQIFASDLDETALAAGREGLYPAAIGADVSAERLRRFFTLDGHHYKVNRALRDCVLFAKHSLLRDPPFSRLDLVSCRNLLIYLDRGLQRRVLGILRYALRPGGFLLVGGSESADGDDFHPLDKRTNLYVVRDTALDRPPRLPDLLFRDSTRVARAAADDRREAAVTAAADLHHSSLEALAPPSVLVDQRRQLLHLSETAGRFLRTPAGVPTRDLAALVLPELEGELDAALFRALDRGEPSLTPFVAVEVEGRRRRVAVQVRPRTAEGEERVALVLFIEGAETLEPSAHAASEEGPLRQLEGELRRAREQYRSTREDYEAGSEELLAANEELQSINEEYRSTAEELETSKEELQSINEELETVNGELRARLDQVLRSKSDLENLIAATDIATLFLDVELRIQWFTPRLEELFAVTEGDRGRSIHDFTHRLRYPSLGADLQRVIDDLVPLEREVESAAGECYLVRLRPYRTLDNRIEGVVATFVDVTERQAAERQLRQNEQRYRLLVESAREYAIFVVDPDGRIATWNDGAERIFGFTEEEILGEPGSLLFTPEDRAAGIPELEIETARSTGRANDERWHQRRGGELFWASGVMEALRDADGAIQGYAKLLRDNTAQKQAEEALLESQGRLAAELAAARALEEMTIAAVAAANLEKTLGVVLAAAVELTGAEAAAIHLLAPDRSHLELVAHRGVPKAARRGMEWLETEGETLIARVQHRGRRQAYDDLRAATAATPGEATSGGQSPARASARALAEAVGASAVQATPLAVRGSAAMGVLTTWWTEPRQLGERELAWLDQWARHTALLVDRARAESELTTFAATLERRVAEQTADLRESEERLRETAASLVRAEQDERRRISQILHDDLQQLLYGIQMRLVTLRRRASDSGHPKLEESADRAYGWLGDAIEVTRRLAVDLSPPLLAEEGLGAALGWLVTQMREVQGLDVELHLEGDVAVADEALRTTLFQITRELLFNVVKHAGCDSARLDLQGHDDRIRLRVEDRGEGFAAEGLDRSTGGGFGLYSVRDRVALYAGEVDIESHPGDGTRITITVPVGHTATA